VHVLSPCARSSGAVAGLAGDIHVIDFPEGIQQLKDRSITPGAFLLRACDGKFTDEDLTDEGNAFTKEYFNFAKGGYLRDYASTLGPGIPDSLYYVADTWDNFDKLRPVLDRRFSEWRGR
jgi:hypothetical protein